MKLFLLFSSACRNEAHNTVKEAYVTWTRVRGVVRRYGSKCPNHRRSNFTAWGHCPKFGHGYGDSSIGMGKLLFEIKLSRVFQEVKGLPPIKPLNTKDPQEM